MRDESRLWAALQRHMGYTDEQMEKFRADPMRVKMVRDTPQFNTHRIIAEVIHSENCHAQHKVGDKLIMNGNGQFLTELCPPKICVWAAAALGAPVNVIFDRFVSQLDPNDMLFNVVQCGDIGLECGGWGKILMKVRDEGPEER